MLRSKRLIILLAFAIVSIAAHASTLPDSIPAVLSKNDIKNYKQLFKFERLLKKDKAAAALQQIENPILMGHIKAERVLHPRTHTPYSSLQSWLNSYADHPQANRIYKLANRRAPKGSIHRNPTNKYPTAARYTDLDTIPSKAAPHAPKHKLKPKLIKRLKYNNKNKLYKDSYNLLSKPVARKIMGGKDWAKQSVRISYQLMQEGMFVQAHHLAGVVARYQSLQKAEALWLSGFAAYRAKMLEEAASSFRTLVYTVPKGSRAYARAAWWGGRTYEQLNKTKLANVLFEMAAENATSFYGQLANTQLGNSLVNNWKNPTLSNQQMSKLIKYPSIKRVIALAQIEEYALAQQELKNAYRSLPYEIDEPLLALSMGLDLPHMAMTLSLNLRDQGKTFYGGLYPVPNAWKPYKGYNVDPSLIFSIMRQESAFDPTIVSHAGARGLMQVMPQTANYMRSKQERFDVPANFLSRPFLNISVGQAYVEYLHSKLNGNVIHMIAAYNAGPGNLRKWKKSQNITANDPIVFIESIPFTETRTYVKRVLSNLWVYRKQFNQSNPTLLALANQTWPGAIALNPKFSPKSKKKEG